MLEKQKMPAWKKVLVGILALLGISVSGYGVDTMLGSVNIVVNETQLWTTSTLANHSDVPWINVDDYNTISFTLLGETASGTLRIACSNQDTMPTSLTSSTANRFDYIDTIDVNTETSIDGWTGVTLADQNITKIQTIRNSTYNWCTGVWSGNTSPAGLGTSTLYVKRKLN